MDEVTRLEQLVAAANKEGRAEDLALLRYKLALARRAAKEAARKAAGRPRKIGTTKKEH